MFVYRYTGLYLFQVVNVFFRFALLIEVRKHSENESVHKNFGKTFFILFKLTELFST